MNETLLLCRKDLRVNGWALACLLALEIVSLALFVPQVRGQAPEGAILVVVHILALAGGFVIAFRLVAVEEKNRSLLFIKSLPVSTRDIALSKFATAVALTVANLGVLLGVYLAARALGLGGATPVFGTSLVVATSAQIFNVSFFVTVALAFNSEKAIWVPFPFLFCLFSVVMSFRTIVTRLGIEEEVRWLAAHPHVIATGLLLASVLAVPLTTYVLSKKKVFG